MKQINIYGAGLYGLTLGRMLQDNGFQVKIFEKEDHIGGMLHTHRRMGIEVHEHGAHLFHTDNDRVIEFVKKYAEWMTYKHRVKSLITIRGQKKLVSMPLSYATLRDLYDLDGEDREAVYEYLLNATSRKRHPNKNIDDLITRIGWDAFEFLIKPYSEKQWGCEFSEINPAVIDRIGMTQDFNEFYFKDKFQALPKDGYDNFLENLACGLNIKTNHPRTFDYDPDVITIYTGPIDDLIGKEILPYRSLRWDTYCDYVDITPLPVVNTPQDSLSTRFIIHNNFMNNPYRSIKIISKEYPSEWKPGMYKYYPVNNEKTTAIYNNAVTELKEKYPNLYLGGRLGSYKYWDMDDTILAALEMGDKLCNEL